MEMVEFVSPLGTILSRHPPSGIIILLGQSLVVGCSSPSLGAGGSCQGPPCFVSGQTLAAGCLVQALDAGGLDQSLGVVGSDQAPLAVGWG